MNDADVFSK